MTRISNAWTRLRIQIRDLRAQLRLCLRVTVAALVSFVLGKSLNIPFGGLWAVLTAVVVTQLSVGGSLKATIEYFTGTLGGAVYAGVIAVLIPPTNEFALLIALAIGVAPLALLAAIDASFRVDAQRGNVRQLCFGRLAGRGYPVIKTIPVIDGFGVDHHQSISGFTHSSTLPSCRIKSLDNDGGDPPRRRLFANE
jgi:hypothetical protein